MNIDPNFHIPLVVGLVMSLLYVASKKKPKEDEQGNTILKLPNFYWIMGVFIIATGIGFLFFASYWASESDALPARIAAIIALVLGLLLFGKGYISSILIKDSGLVETSMFGKEKEILWNEIEKITFGKVSLELKIQSSNRNKIKAHLHLVGFDELVSTLEEKTGKTRSQLGIP